MADEDPIPRPEVTRSARDFDAPLSEKAAWERRKLGLPVERFDALTAAQAPSPRPTRNVRLRGQAALNAADDRQPLADQHNWIPTGPRNVGGRVRTLALHPTDPNILYAGPASGGVYKSADGGETWFPLWHDEPSLAMGSIAIARSSPDRVYVGTGEIQTGGGELIPGVGVLRSDDGGVNWRDPVMPGAAPNRLSKIETLAVHPTNPDICWAVGPAGVFRTSNGGTGWDEVLGGTYFSDVAISESDPDRVYFIQAQALYTPPADPTAPIGAGNQDQLRAFVIRLDAANGAIAAVRTAFAAAANRARLFRQRPAVDREDEGNWPARAKIALCRGAPQVAYVRLTDQNGGHMGLLRCRNATATPPSGMTWRQTPDHVDWADEAQGTYNLTIAVDPNNANSVVTGMVELYISRNANGALASVTWLRAMAWDLYALDRAHHADNNQAIFATDAATGNTTDLWVANDGGISRSSDWGRAVAALAGYQDQVRISGAGNRIGQTTTLPLPANVITWRKRSHGISAAQMYDLTQSPLMPSLYGCGFQDNGVFVTTGGDTWRFVMSADGGFVAFDPNDPYRFLATYQSAITEAFFAGQTSERMPPAGFSIILSLWPRELTIGFLVSDGARFVADTLHHPEKSFQALHTREHRLYETRDGETWSPLPVGSSLELHYQPAGSPHLEVVHSAGADRLGIPPHVSQGNRVARIYSIASGPYNLSAGDQLQVRLNGGAVQRVTFNAGGDIADLSQAQAYEVAAAINRTGIANLTAYARFANAPSQVELNATNRAVATRIALAGSALPRLGGEARTYAGVAGQPASVTLPLGDGDLSRPTGAAADLDLQATIDGGTTRTVTFDTATFTNPAKVGASELARVINGALAGDPASARASAHVKAILIRATAAGGITFGGTGLARLGLALPTAPPSFFNWVRLFPNDGPNFDISDLPANPGVNLTLTIQGLANPALPITFATGGTLTGLNSVAPEELQRIIAGALAGDPTQAVCELEYLAFVGEPSEIAFGAKQPNTAAVGGTDGSVFLSTDDARSWREITDRARWTRDRPIEAIAVDPEDHTILYVGFLGEFKGAGDDGFLFKSENQGADWAAIGNGADGVVDGDGNPVGIHAIEVDPAATDQVYVATDVGVFHSGDAGASWEPFNNGLPNVQIRDLAFAASTRTLRAGAWGRGTFERHVGARAVKNVHLYLRASILDDGATRPPPGGFDGMAEVPRLVGLTESPDIKANSVRPPGVGADEVVDGVEFDLDIDHIEPFAGAAHLFAQVHNRGAFPATSVRLVAIWSNATLGPPRLHEDFWTSFAAGGALTLGDWTQIGDFTFTDVPPGLGRDRVVAGHPRVHTFDYTWPDSIGEAGEIAIVLLTHSPDDPLETEERDVNRLIESEPRAACRITRTRGAADTSLIRLERAGSAQFTLAAPAGGATNALGNLGLAAGGPVDQAQGNPGPYNLGAGAPQGFNLALTHSLNLTFQAGEAANMAAVTEDELVQMINRAFRVHRIPLTCFALINRRVVIRDPNGWAAVNATRFRITGGSALATLGLAVSAAAGVRQVQTVAAPFNLAAIAPATLTFAAPRQLDVLLTQGPDAIPDLAAARAEEVARLVDRQLAGAFLPVHALAGTVDARFRRSVTGGGEPGLALGGGHLADLAASDTAVAPGAAREALFDLIQAHGADRVTHSRDNFLYLRALNDGFGDVNARLRLFELALSADPITAGEIAGGAKLADVLAGGSVVEEFTWNPGAREAGAHVVVLAVIDQAAVRELDVPAEFDGFDAVEAFVTQHPNAGYRVFAVAAP